MKFTEILRQNRELGAKFTGDSYKIALLSNITINPLKEVLEFALRVRNIYAEIFVGDYDNIIQDCNKFQHCDSFVIFWEVANFVDFFDYRINLYKEDDLVQLIQRVEGEINMIIDRLQNAPLVIINRFSLTLFNSNILGNDIIKKFCNRLNALLEYKATSNFLIIDLDAVLSQVGLKNAIDFRQYYLSKAPYTIDFVYKYANAFAPAFCAVNGKTKKLLVLDCDNTLWGGVLGEDGETGIKLGTETLLGKCFTSIQYLIKGLQLRGVLLALCSKNNPDDVYNLFLNHPGMILSKSDFVANKINWKDKATNLKELSKELNLGLESFIFIDDSEFEIGLIHNELPQVKCIQVPKNISEFPAIIESIRNDFFSFTNTQEDQNRTEMYVQEALRRQQEEKFKTIEEYLASLGLTMEIIWNEKIPIERAAQLTQKTNQFNLTTNRYTESEIKKMLDDKSNIIVLFSVSDKYGDYGVTGMAIIKILQERENTALIDTFLMSCRVIGRNLEYAFFNQIALKLQELDISEIVANYFATPKNSQVEYFYDNLGFENIYLNSNQKNYKLELSSYKTKSIDYIQFR